MNKTNISNIEVSYDLNIIQTSLTVLQKALPQSYNYIIDSFEVAQPHNFLGAYKEPFIAKFYINICTGKKFDDLSVDKKKSTSIHMRDTNCPVILSIQVQNKLDTHSCIVKTKEAFFELFYIKHSPASAHYIYLEEIQLKYENDKKILADQAICPNKQNIYYLHQMFLDKSISAKNRKEMFNHLVKEVMKFNDSKKGSAWMQSYVIPTESDPEQSFILIILTNLMKH
ncbi:20337_t:CDS:2, partial [Cetraspora pellucida]